MALVLTRMDGDSVLLFTEAGEVISITLDLVTWSKVKLTFRAPDSVKILRAELIDQNMDAESS